MRRTVTQIVRGVYGVTQVLDPIIDIGRGGHQVDKEGNTRSYSFTVGILKFVLV